MLDLIFLALLAFASFLVACAWLLWLVSAVAGIIKMLRGDTI